MQRTRVSGCHYSRMNRLPDRCMLPDTPQESFSLLHSSFQQRHAESPVVDVAFDIANPGFPAPRAEVTTPGYSRSASVVSSIVGRQDEDISSIMMRGATDLRNAKYEIEEQACHALDILFRLFIALLASANRIPSITARECQGRKGRSPEAPSKCQRCCKAEPGTKL